MHNNFVKPMPSHWLHLDSNYLIKGMSSNLLTLIKKAAINKPIEEIFGGTFKQGICEMHFQSNDELVSVQLEWVEDKNNQTNIETYWVHIPEFIDIASFDNQIQFSNEFIRALKTIPEIINQISNAESIDDVYRLSVHLGLTQLNFERMAVVFLVDDGKEMLIPYGTDTNGRVTERQEWRYPMQDVPWLKKAIDNKNQITCWSDILLREFDQIIGRGWNIMVPMWHNNVAIGWLTLDNAVRLGELTNDIKLISYLYASNLGQLITRKWAEEELKTQNTNLESLVSKQTHQLHRQLDKLTKAQNYMVETEKFAALGSLVSGVAHEINTPIGICLTMASQINNEVVNFKNAIDNNRIKKSDLNNHIETLTEATDIILSNVNRASNIIHSFKKLATDQHEDPLTSSSLEQIASDAIVSLSHIIKAKNIEVKLNIDPNILMHSFIGSISQVFTNLIQNSIVHGFDPIKETKHSTIKIWAKQINNDVFLFYEDNGIGLKPDLLGKIFDPFYTTKRGSGGTGLGLNILINIINQKLLGRVSAATVSPHGLSFIIMLPLKQLE